MRLRSFVAEGYFNDIIALNEDIPLAATQGELIPVQKEILLKGKQIAAEEAQGESGANEVSGGHRNAAHGNTRTQRRSFKFEDAEEIT